MALLHPKTTRSSLLSKLGACVGWKDPLHSLVSSYARSQIFHVLESGLKHGHLVVEDTDGIYHFGQNDAHTTVTMKVNNPNMWTRIFLGNDMGLSEAYMESEFDVSSLKDLLNLWLDNRTTLAGLSTTLSSLFAYYSALAIKSLGRQGLAMARWNVEVAYDTSNAFYQSILSKEMMYSCAIWGDEEGGVRGDLVAGSKKGDLEAAQHRKIHTILKKARVKAGSRLLEIGSGWGAMAVEAALLGCEVDTVTLSREQMEKTLERAAAAGVPEKVRVHLCDYRELPASFKHSFDAAVSCEMVEAVGYDNMHKYFRALDWALKKDKGAVVITATSQPEYRWTAYQPDDFARHYHWPNTHLPSSTSLAIAAQQAVPGKFVLYNLEDHGIHYPRTLREWGRRLDANFHGHVVEELQAKFPQLRSKQALEGFKRKWHYMFVYAEVGYARAYTSLMCWTFARPENVSTICA